MGLFGIFGRMLVLAVVAGVLYLLFANAFGWMLP